MNKKKLYIISFLLFVIDIISKLFVANYLDYNNSETIIKNFFYINYVRNKGGAFSIMEGNVIFIIIVTIIVFFFIYKYLKNKKLDLLEVWGYGLIIGGSIGNLYDRIIYGYVIDFLDFYIFKYDFPVFNIADCGIVVGVFLIIIDSIKNESSDKYENKSRRVFKNR